VTYDADGPNVDGHSPQDHLLGENSLAMIPSFLEETTSRTMKAAARSYPSMSYAATEVVSEPEDGVTPTLLSLPGSPKRNQRFKGSVVKLGATA
jgi:hypothetical protein